MRPQERLIPSYILCSIASQKKFISEAFCRNRIGRNERWPHVSGTNHKAFLENLLALVSYISCSYWFILYLQYRSRIMFAMVFICQTLYNVVFEFIFGLHIVIYCHNYIHRFHITARVFFAPSFIEIEYANKPYVSTPSFLIPYVMYIMSSL